MNCCINVQKYNIQGMMDVYILYCYLERAAEPLLTSSTALMAEPKPPLTEFPASTQHNYTAVRSGQRISIFCVSISNITVIKL